MPKTQNVPVHLRDFNRIFEEIAYRHQYSEVFTDFLSMFIKGFDCSGTDYTKQNTYWQEKYKQKERHNFGNLIFEYLKLFKNHVITDNLWYDGLGEYYELITSTYKSQAMGQFFTPGCITDLMTQITSCGKQTGLKINDPTCGSGRTLLSYNAYNPGNYYFAEDLDIICCKMCCINMMLHGMVGEVVHHNSLLPDSFYEAWHVNSTLKFGIPSIVPIAKEESYIYKSAIAETKNRLNNIDNKQVIVLKKEKTEQLSLF